MEKFGWTYQEYQERPLWFDTIYQLKMEAEAEVQKAEIEKAKKDNG